VPKKSGFVKFNSIKEYINTKKRMRSSAGAVKKIMKDFDSAIEVVIEEGEALAKLDKRNTIMEQDVIPALEKLFAKKYLTWEETAKEIIRQNPADLGKISKAINDYIERQKDESKRADTRPRQKILSHSGRV